MWGPNKVVFDVSISDRKSFGHFSSNLPFFRCLDINHPSLHLQWPRNQTHRGEGFVDGRSKCLKAYRPNVGVRVYILNVGVCFGRNLSRMFSLTLSKPPKADSTPRLTPSSPAEPWPGLTSYRWLWCNQYLWNKLEKMCNGWTPVAFTNFMNCKWENWIKLHDNIKADQLKCWGIIGFGFVQF